MDRLQFDSFDIERILTDKNNVPLDDSTLSDLGLATSSNSSNHHFDDEAFFLSSLIADSQPLYPVGDCKKLKTAQEQQKDEEKKTREA